jgi:hypothetical protein
VFFGGPWNGKCWYIWWSLGIIYGLLVHLWPLGIFYGHLVKFFPVLVYSTKKSGNPGRQALSHFSVRTIEYDTCLSHRLKKLSWTSAAPFVFETSTIFFVVCIRRDTKLNWSKILLFYLNYCQVMFWTKAALFSLAKNNK